MSKSGNVIDVESPTGKKRFRILEKAVDPPNTIKRELIEITDDTDTEDIPENSRLLDERETDGHLARAARPDNIQVGDIVTRRINPGDEITEKSSVKGTVDAKLRSGKF